MIGQPLPPSPDILRPQLGPFSLERRIAVAPIESQCRAQDDVSSSAVGWEERFEDIEPGLQLLKLRRGQLLK